MTSSVDIRAPRAVTPALDLVRRSVLALSPYLQPSGALNDPVHQMPTQYGNAYFAYLNAVLASKTDGAERAKYIDAAERGLRETLRHLHDMNDPAPAAADFTYDVGSPGFRNLRDFMWPPVLRTLRLLREMGQSDLTEIDQSVRTVAVPEVFSERPPVNWAAVWILGEYQRIADGLSPFPPTAIDDWLEPFFTENPDVDHGFYRELQLTTNIDMTWSSAIDLERGFYREPGVPNSYDLWCRVHLLELLVEGYSGKFQPQMEQLLVSGMRRSLAVQLSSGSLATAYRSSAHLWNLTGQCWYFYHGAQLLRSTHPDLSAAAEAAAYRAFCAVTACVRPTGDMSPVENVLPASYRVGYEVYTMEAHYVTLALAYLATAVLDGFSGEGMLPTVGEPRVHIEPDPVHRHLLHGDNWSAHVCLNPFPGYDPLGLADLTLGLGRRLRFGGQAHYGRPDGKPELHRMWSQAALTLGIAVRAEDRSIHPISAMTPRGKRVATGNGRTLEASTELEDMTYQIRLQVDGDVMRIRESVGERACSLMVPYLRDCGDGALTEVTIADNRIRLVMGKEIVEIVPSRRIERAVHFAYGYESRHGLLGLVRIDLADIGPVEYEVRRLA